MTVSEKDGPVREEETPGVVSRSQAKEGLQEWEECKHNGITLLYT